MNAVQVLSTKYLLLKLYLSTQRERERDNIKIILAKKINIMKLFD